jgi:hypothetical protein
LNHGVVPAFEFPDWIHKLSPHSSLCKPGPSPQGSGTGEGYQNSTNGRELSIM